MSNKTAIIVLLIIVGVGSLFFSYKYVYQQKTDKKETIEAEIATLEVTRAELEEENAHKEEYEAEIKENYEYFYAQLDKFPGNLNQDVSVMFMKGIEKEKSNLKFLIDTVGLEREELFYTVAAPANDEFGNAQYECYKAEYPIQYTGNYEGIKDVIDFVMNYKYRMNCSELNIAYDSVSDTYTGNITFNAYSVNGSGRPDDKADVNEKEGKTNPFLDTDGGSSVVTSSHDEDNGDSIATSYDVKIDLNNANGDSTDGIVLTAGSDVLSSAANKVEDVNVKIEEKDGKIVAVYSIGGDTIETEVAGTEVAVYVESSERVDSDDTNGIKLNIDNSTDIAVFVKVSGDDSASPRFNLGSKSGTVKVY